MSIARQKIVTNQKAELIGVASELFVVTAIFACIRFCHDFFKGLGHRILFPLAGFFSLYRAVFAWRGLFLEGASQSKLWHITMETLAALAISTAVIGGIVAEAIFKTISPLIFTVLLAVKTVYNLMASLLYGFRAYLSGKDSAYQLFKANAFATFTNALSTVACGFVFVAQQVSMAVLGIAAGVLTAAYALYHVVTLPYSSDEEQGNSRDSATSRINIEMVLGAAGNPAVVSGVKIPIHDASLSKIEKQSPSHLPSSSSFYSRNDTIKDASDLDEELHLAEENAPLIMDL